MRQFVDSPPPTPPLPWPAGAEPPIAARWLESDLPRVEEQLALDDALLEETHAGRLTAPVCSSNPTRSVSESFDQAAWLRSSAHS